MKIIVAEQYWGKSEKECIIEIEWTLRASPLEEQYHLKKSNCYRAFIGLVTLIYLYRHEQNRKSSSPKIACGKSYHPYPSPTSTDI